MIFEIERTTFSGHIEFPFQGEYWILWRCLVRLADNINSIMHDQEFKRLTYTSLSISNCRLTVPWSGHNAMSYCQLVLCIIKLGPLLNFKSRYLPFITRYCIMRHYDTIHIQWHLTFTCYKNKYCQYRFSIDCLSLASLIKCFGESSSSSKQAWN